MCRSIDCFKLGWPLRLDSDYFYTLSATDEVNSSQVCKRKYCDLHLLCSFAVDVVKIAIFLVSDTVWFLFPSTELHVSDLSIPIAHTLTL